MNSSYEYNRDDLLRPEFMILLYSKGAFPMADEEGNINWYMPETRTIIPIDEFNIPRSLRKFMENSDFEFRYDTRIMDVIKNCADRKNTWINDKLLDAYRGIMKLGHVHSVEVFQKNNLVGGLYGITYKGAFYGESMFSNVSQASKSALVKLVEKLIEREFVLLDVQFMTEHLRMFGAKEISLGRFNELQLEAHTRDATFN